MRFGGVMELDDQRMLLQHRVDDAALNALAAAVNQPDLAYPRLVCGGEVFGDDRRDVPRSERMQIECALDRDSMRHGRQAAL